jgi:phosphoadenosine phosphosulfate reductase
MSRKIVHAKEIIERAVEQYENIAVGCSFGKDSVVTVHLIQQVKPDIPVFSIMTRFKPEATFVYLRKMKRLWNLRLTVYMVADEVPGALRDDTIRIELLPTEEFNQVALKTRRETGKPIYEANPDMCCQLLKVDATKAAVQHLDAWFSGLRNTEGRTRRDYQEIEKRGDLAKINPILQFTENDVLQYAHDHHIPLHPWYSKKLPDGRRYRSLGCAPCTRPIYGHQLERDGRWQNTSKCGGECGIHTKVLKQRQWPKTAWT